MRALGGVGGIVVQRRALEVEVEILAFEIVFEVVAARGSVRGSAARADPHAVHLQGRAGGADLGRRAEGFASRAGGTPADLAAVHAARLATSLRVRVRVGENARVRVLRRAGDAQTAETDVGVGRAGGSGRGDSHCQLHSFPPPDLRTRVWRVWREWRGGGRGEKVAGGGRRRGGRLDVREKRRRGMREREARAREGAFAARGDPRRARGA